MKNICVFYRSVIMLIGLVAFTFSNVIACSISPISLTDTIKYFKVEVYCDDRSSANIELEVFEEDFKSSQIDISVFKQGFEKNLFSSILLNKDQKKCITIDSIKKLDDHMETFLVLDIAEMKIDKTKETRKIMIKVEGLASGTNYFFRVKKNEDPISETIKVFAPFCFAGDNNED